MRRLANALHVLCTSALLATPSWAQGNQQQTTPSVVVLETQMSDVTPSFDFVGRVEAQATVELRARVEGFLEARNFREGGNVTKDTPLFVIEKAPYEIALQQANADLSGSQATFENAQAEFNRTNTLVQRGTLAQASLDQARATLGSARAAKEQAEAAVARAELNLSYTEVKSPFDGIISAAAYDVGNLVGPSSGALATVTTVDPIYVTIEVSDRGLIAARERGIDLDNPQVAPTVTLANGERYSEPGEFDYLAPSVNISTDTVTARAVFSNPDRRLVPGQLVTVSVREKEPVSAIRVPQAAVQEDSQGFYVLVVSDDSVANIRRITVADQIETDWVVSEGLEPNEQVVLRGIQKVRPGQPVNAVSDDEA